VASERREVALWPYVVGAIVVLVVCFFLARLWRTDEARRKFEARVQALRDAGEPTEARELERPFVPPERNANYQLMQAHAWYQARDSRPRVRSRHLIDGNLDPAEEEKVRTFLTTLGPYLEQLERTVRCDGAYAERNWSDGPHRVDIPEFAAMTNAAEILAMLAFVDPATAAQHATLMLRLAERVHLPFMLGDLLAGAYTTYAVKIFKAAAAAPSFDARAFREAVDPLIARALGAWGPDRQRLRAERTLLIWVGRHPDAMAQYLAEEDPPLNPAAVYDDLHMKLDAIDAAIDASDVTPREALSSKSEWAIVENWFHQHGMQAARLRLFRVAMALAEHRQEQGSWPAGLAGLGPLPQDPVTGGSFAYVRTKAGARLFVDDPRANDEECLRYEFK